MNQAWAKSGNPGTKLSSDDLASLWLNAGGTCEYCGIGVSLMTVSFDHEVPLSKGGYHGVGNLKVCCITCQRSKYNRSTKDYLDSRALTVTCPVDGTVFKPRWADWVRGYGRFCSRKCAGTVGAKRRG